MLQDFTNGRKKADAAGLLEQGNEGATNELFGVGAVGPQANLPKVCCYFEGCGAYPIGESNWSARELDVTALRKHLRERHRVDYSEAEVICFCNRTRIIKAGHFKVMPGDVDEEDGARLAGDPSSRGKLAGDGDKGMVESCLLYTSPSPRDGLLSRMPSSA